MYSVDTRNQRDVWLVKVPKYIANAWKEAPDGTELGKLQVQKGQPNGPIKFVSNANLRLPTAGASKAATTNGQLPSEHKLSLQPLTHQKMVILTQTKDAPSNPNDNSNNERIAFEGDVKFRGELRPTGDMSYMSLKTNLIREAAKPVRVTQILDKAVTSYKPRGATQLAHEADMRKKKEESKKSVREDKEIVQARLFAAFEKQQFYNIKDLVRITNQSIPYLKEILKEICNYCSKSTHKSMWELKPEYRHYKASSSSTSGTGVK